MKKLILALACGAALGCVQVPTETQGVADLRPQVSFRFDAGNTQAATARVLIDGLDVGAVQDYAEGRAALRVAPGNHQLQVVRAGQVLLAERFYAGDGVNRSFLLK